MKLFGTRQISKGAIVIALVALVAALGGSAIAGKKAKKVTTGQLAKGAVTGPKLAKGAVTGPKLAKGAVASKVVFTRINGPQLTVSGTESKAATVTCPTGSQAISGGAELLNPANDANGAAISSSQRDTNAAAWTTRVESSLPGGKTYQLSAVCVALG